MWFMTRKKINQCKHPEMTGLIELADKKFEAVLINMLTYIKDLKKNMNKGREMKYMKQLPSTEKNYREKYQRTWRYSN